MQVDQKHLKIKENSSIDEIEKLSQSTRPEHLSADYITGISLTKCKTNVPIATISTCCNNPLLSTA